MKTFTSSSIRFSPNYISLTRSILWKNLIKSITKKSNSTAFIETFSTVIRFMRVSTVFLTQESSRSTSTSKMATLTSRTKSTLSSTTS